MSEAAYGGVRLQIIHMDGSGQLSRRQATTMQMLGLSGHIYLKDCCRLLRNDERDFRLSLVLSFQVEA